MKNLRSLLIAAVCIMVLMFSYVQQRNAVFTAFQDSADSDRLKVYQYVKIGSEFVELMSIYGNKFMASDISENGHLLKYLKDDRKTNTFNMDGLEESILSRTNSNITGTGSFFDDPIKYKEIQLATHFNEYFSAMYQSMPGVSWIYYTSLNQFISLYPFATSEEFVYSDALLEQEFITKGKREVNKNRESYWSRPYMDLAGKGLMITVSGPVDYKEKFLGAVSLDLTLQMLSELLTKDYIGIIVNPEGEVLASSMADLHPANKIFMMKDFFHYNAEKNMDDLKEAPFDSIVDIENYMVIKKQIPETDWIMYTMLLKSTLLSRVLSAFVPILLIALLLIFVTSEAERRKRAEVHLSEVNGELERISIVDYLTGLLNRRGMNQRIREEAAYHIRYDNP